MSIHNYSEISFLTTYITLQSFYIICISETLLASSIDINRRNLAEVCSYYKNILPLIVLSTNFLQVYINFEIAMCWFICLVRSPRQYEYIWVPRDNYNLKQECCSLTFMPLSKFYRKKNLLVKLRINFICNFLKHLEINLDDSFNRSLFLITAVGDVNAKPSK